LRSPSIVNPFLCFGFVPFPLSVEEVVQVGCSYPSKCSGDWVCWYPNSERLILCWLCALPLMRGCIYWREELCTSICICPNPQWRFPVWEVLCGRYSRNPSV